MESWRHRDIETGRWRPGNMEKWRHGEMETSNRNGKLKPRRFSLIPFAHHANWNLFFFPLLTKKQRELSICKRNKRTKWTCPSMLITSSFDLPQGTALGTGTESIYLPGSMDRCGDTKVAATFHGAKYQGWFNSKSACLPVLRICYPSLLLLKKKPLNPQDPKKVLSSCLLNKKFL